ncbi:MAG TPA: HAMP domain-containing sensor histidine kinase [Oscillospiraceae bacterium]|nr:HAMP domain-containing sensor histidine kinase [Oscillospiraceae bacterium]
MKELKYSLTAKISAFCLLYLNGYILLISAYNFVVGGRIEELVVRNIWPFSWFLTSAGIMLPLTIVVSILLFSFLLAAAGTQRNSEELVLNRWDRIPTDLISLGCGTLFLLGVIILPITGGLGIGTITSYYDLSTDVGLGIYLSLILFYLYSIFMLWCITIVKRLRTQTLLTNTLFYRLYDLLRKIFLHLTEVYQAGVAVIIFGLINITVIFNMHSGLAMLFFLMFNSAVLLFILYLALQVSQLKQNMQKIAAGQLKVNLDSTKFTLTFKEQAQALNAISAGLQKAVEERMSSERLKTELITNVSHDIKTPLTSIINYVDLLKKTALENEQALAYLDVLEQKSYRLKDLIEDLMEASKASTGNLTVDLTEINVNELLKQITGEYDERLRERGLEVIQTVPGEKVVINGDRRHLSRLLENLFSNVKKYAQPQTRVYLDLEATATEMKLIIKNISAEKLNISPEELMERFVRGDKARHTEGSGLGLSIARSLAEIQGGKFNIKIVGDLFEVELIFPVLKEEDLLQSG